MEYLVMFALIPVLATGCLIVAAKVSYHSDKGNKKTTAQPPTDTVILYQSKAATAYRRALFLCSYYIYIAQPSDFAPPLCSFRGKGTASCVSLQRFLPRITHFAPRQKVCALFPESKRRPFRGSFRRQRLFQSGKGRFRCGSKLTQPFFRRKNAPSFP